MSRNRNNSTAVELELRHESSRSMTNISSISPVSESRDNSMSFSTSQDSVSSSSHGEPNVSLYLKHNINAVNLDDPQTQGIALRYVLEKARDLETIVISSAKSNQVLQDDVTKLYRQNDALAAENVTMQDTILTMQDTISALRKENNSLFEEMDGLKEVLLSERDRFTEIIATNSRRMSEDVKALEDDVDYLGEFIPVINELASNVKELNEDIVRIDKDLSRIDSRMDKEITDTNQKIKEADDHIDFLEKVIIRTEKEVVVTNQYNRRQNLIIDGIPDDVPQKHLENVCVDIIRNLGFVGRLGSYEIIGCHRLKKKEGDVTTPVIIRFFNRKITEFCMKNRRKLRNARSTWNLSFREDLCEANLVILERWEKLKNDGVLAKVYTHNGFVKVAKTMRDRPIRLAHISELNDLLPNV